MRTTQSSVLTSFTDINGWLDQVSPADGRITESLFGLPVSPDLTWDTSSSGSQHTGAVPAGIEAQYGGEPPFTSPEHVWAGGCWRCLPGDQGQVSAVSEMNCHNESSSNAH